MIAHTHPKIIELKGVGGSHEGRAEPGAGGRSGGGWAYLGRGQKIAQSGMGARGDVDMSVRVSVQVRGQTHA